ncbi:MAG: hypothetical protein AMK72_04265 [Planctomycetes bacterium SM23_25]|nr:MAG: hypothetical protein AMS14_07260 [Planctomycetes bacterium DG_20]KPK49537.1 MAG: hypothetical protein AMK72_04265 [Planctomycetes bacterium SM23_25]
MNPLFEAAVEVQRFLESRGWSFCFIGGLAVARWGEPRATRDLDVTVLSGFGQEERYVGEVLDHFAPRVADAREFARQSRVVLFRAGNGVPVDMALGGIPFEESMVRRATAFAFAPGVSLLTCSAEDLIVQKAFADRPRDWADVEGVVVRQAGALDWEYIHEQLGPLCEVKADSAIMPRLDEIRDRTARE